MTTLSNFFFLLAAVALLFVVVYAIRSIRTYFRFRGKHIITCPETHQPAVDVDARRVA